MFERKIYKKLLDWKQTSDGKTALLIEGARRIGKSTVVEEFGRNEYKTYILIDFSIAPRAVKELFEDMSDLDYFFYSYSFNIKKTSMKENHSSFLMRSRCVRWQGRLLRLL